MRPRRRFVAWALGGLAAATLLAALGITRSIDARWAAFVAEVETLEADVARHPNPRPLLWLGEAWAAYDTPDPSSPAKPSTLSEATRLDLLTALQSRASRTERNGEFQDLALGEAKSQLDAGHPREAAYWLLAGFQFGHDLRQPGSKPRLHQPIAQCASLLAAGRWPQEVLEILGVGLRILDDSFPSPTQDRNGYLAGVGRTILDSDGPTWDWSLGCRYLGSSKWIKIEAFEGYKHLSRLEYEPGPSDSIALQQVVAICARNPFMYGLEPGFWEGRSVFMPRVLQPRVARTKVRLLRLAVAALRGDPLPALEDPFTGRPLLVEPGPRPRKFWSAGANFLDDGGLGDFSGVGKDLVLDLPR